MAVRVLYSIVGLSNRGNTFTESPVLRQYLYFCSKHIFLFTKKLDLTTD